MTGRESAGPMTYAFPVKLQEIKRAYNRAKADRPDRCFVEHPFLLQWAEIDRNEWLEQLREKMASGFNPHSSKLSWVPKANSLLRPAHILHLKDEIVYNLVIDRLYEPIWGLLCDYQGEPDAAYVMQEPGCDEWFKGQFEAWEGFREASLRYLTEGAKHVVVSDITGFYENIDLLRLLSELRQIANGIRPEIELLGKCLRKWSSRGDKGIPQGYSASDVLAKVYIHTVDVALQNDGFRYLRYVDDIRIFCDSRLDAKRAIQSLSTHIHEKGLNLQSAKTRILTKGVALREFNGVRPIVDGVQKKLIAEILDDISEEAPYSDPENAELVVEMRENLPAEVLEKTFKEYFGEADPALFDKTLFHYLLNRLAKADSKIAVSYCLAALRERPEETSYVLKYLGRVDLQKSELGAVTKFLVSPSAIYDYQSYRVLKWLFDCAVRSERVLGFCRRVVQDQNRDTWLRSYALAYLGKFGQIADLHLIESLYSRYLSDFERAGCVMAMSRTEVGKRNAFYASIQGDGALIARSVALAKRLSKQGD
jgi:hypothetical protein